MADLKTTYKDDVLNTSANEKRKYNMITNEDGTVSLVDATDYSQVGDSFGAADINATNEKVNELNTNLSDIHKNNFGTRITLTATYSLSNPFIVPEDGYLEVYRGSLRVYGSTGTMTSSNFAFALYGGTDNESTSSTFVRKGMRVVFAAGTEGCKYVPLT